MSVPIEQFCKGFRSLYLVLAAIPFVPPMLSAMYGHFAQFAAELFPPLGYFESLGIISTLIVLFLSTFAVYFWRRTVPRVHPAISVILILVCIAGVCAQIYLWQNYVRLVPIASVDKELVVSIGYERTSLAQSVYAKNSDAEMLHERPSEQGIQDLWTARSLAAVRAFLWASYTLTLVCWSSIVALCVYQSVLDDLQQSPTKESSAA